MVDRGQIIPSILLSLDSLLSKLILFLIKRFNFGNKKQQKGWMKNANSLPDSKGALLDKQKYSSYHGYRFKQSSTILLGIIWR